MLLVKKLIKTAMLPSVAHPNEDAGFDLRCIEAFTIPSKGFSSVRTGVAAQYKNSLGKTCAMKVEGRSSLGSLGIFTISGILDSLYSGEIIVFLGNMSDTHKTFYKGDKIAQLVPHTELADEVKEVDILPEGNRGTKGFGSSDVAKGA